jgi:hypothetical protein
LKARLIGGLPPPVFSVELVRAIPYNLGVLKPQAITLKRFAEAGLVAAVERIATGEGRRGRTGEGKEVKIR